MFLEGMCEDARDERPMIYPGRLLLPAAPEKEKKAFWKKSALFTDGRTAAANQMPGKEMRQVERVGEGLLPGTTDADTSVRGALKTAQMGPDAASKILKLVVETRQQKVVCFRIHDG